VAKIRRFGNVVGRLRLRELLVWRKGLHS
jgi:hypothetical protein